MIANAYWLRRIADKYNIEGVDRKVIEGCAEKLEALGPLAEALERNAAEAHNLAGLVAGAMVQEGTR